MNIPEYCEIPSCSVSAWKISEEDKLLSQIHGIDRCVLPELQKLWSEGISTYCSCCGHGNDDKAFIRVGAEYAERMAELGYERYEPHDCLVHKNTVAYRAKFVKQEREKGRPDDSRDINEIREMWKQNAGLA